MHFNIILPYTPVSSEWRLSISFPHQNLVRNCPLPHTCHILSPQTVPVLSNTHATFYHPKQYLSSPPHMTHSITPNSTCPLPHTCHILSPQTVPTRKLPAVAVLPISCQLIHTNNKTETCDTLGSHGHVATGCLALATDSNSFLLTVALCAHSIIPSC
jgi:hypothetical protein